MSYDLSIWCIRPFQDEKVLPEPGRWTRHGPAWSLEGEGWILNLRPSARVQAEDVPDGVFGLLPGIEHVVYLALEPIDAPKAGFVLLRKTAKAIARAAKGVVFDPQRDSVELPSGTKRYSSAKHEGDQIVSLLEMSWWIEHAKLLEPATIDRFLGALATYLPEALPRRYGLWEPPQHELSKTGRAHLVEFLAKHLTKDVVWYTRSPVVSLSFSIPSSIGWQQIGPHHGYACHHISLEVVADVLDQPGWPTALHRLWRALSAELSPFYGDVRTFKGWIQHGSRYFASARTEAHPVQSWWWDGIPPRLGHAVAIGLPYLDLWPNLAKRAEMTEGLAFATTPDWRSDEDVADLLGGVPPDLALPFMPYPSPTGLGYWQMTRPENYPPVFPFSDRLTWSVPATSRKRSG